MKKLKNVIFILAVIFLIVTSITKYMDSFDNSTPMKAMYNALRAYRDEDVYKFGKILGHEEKAEYFTKDAFVKGATELFLEEGYPEKEAKEYANITWDKFTDIDFMMRHESIQDNKADVVFEITTFDFDSFYDEFEASEVGIQAIKEEDLGKLLNIRAEALKNADTYKSETVTIIMELTEDGKSWVLSDDEFMKLMEFL